MIYDWWKGANHGTPARVFYLKKTYQWLFSHSLSDKDRPVNRNISITMSDLGRAYGDVNRNAPQPELIDGPSVIKQEGMNIKESGEQFCYLLQPILINIIEGAEVFTVNIQYGDYLTIPDNRHYYLRTGGAAAGNMPRKFLYIFYHDGLRFIPSRSANTLAPLMRVQASGPWKGPSTRVPSMTL